MLQIFYITYESTADTCHSRSIALLCHTNAGTHCGGLTKYHNVFLTGNQCESENNCPRMSVVYLMVGQMTWSRRLSTCFGAWPHWAHPSRPFMGPICLGRNHSQVYPHMRAKFGHDRSSRLAAYTWQTHTHTQNLYYIDIHVYIYKLYVCIVCMCLSWIYRPF